MDNTEGVICLASDVLVYSRAPEEHNRNPKDFLWRCVQRGKCERTKIGHGFMALAFQGHILTDNGLMADHEKVKTIAKTPLPTDPKVISWLNETVSYLHRFLLILEDLLKSAKQLTHTGTQGRWGTDKNSFERIKKTISTIPILAYYRPHLPLVVQRNRSRFGLGAVLLQNGRPVDYRRCSHFPTEKNYSQMEKKMLGIVLSLARFHIHAYDRRMVIRTDPSLLKPTTREPLSDVSKHLQGIFI